MQKFNDLVKNLDLVYWHAGHFGAFFVNLINAANIDNENHFKRFDNREWSLIDYFGFYHYGKDLEFLKQQCHDLYQDDWQSHYFYVLYQLMHVNITQYNDPSEWINIRSITKDDIVNLIDRPVYNVDIRYRLTKCHEDDYFFLNDNLSWRNKSAVLLPENKKWIGDVMLLAKHNFTVSHLEVSLGKTIDYDLIKKKNFKTVDIYSIVFNHDLTTVYENCPKFVLTQKEQNLLDTVKQDSLEILNSLGLDYEFSVNSASDLDALINKIKLKY